MMQASSDPEGIVVVDVGGAGGLQEKWRKVGDRIVPILFEPNPAEAASLYNAIAALSPLGSVIQAGLFNVIGPQHLNIAAFWGCTSLLKPNLDFLRNYRIWTAFNIVNTESIDCTRYDSLHRDGQVPSPDVIKIDVQGCELEVLQGFGGLLQNCLSIELETHVYPLYHGQSLLHDIIKYLAGFGFVLRKLDSVPNFDGDLVEFDAVFSKSRHFWNEFSLLQKRKFSLICEVCQIVDYQRINPTAHHHHIDPVGAIS